MRKIKYGITKARTVQEQISSKYDSFHPACFCQISERTFLVRFHLECDDEIRDDDKDVIVRVVASRTYSVIKSVRTCQSWVKLLNSLPTSKPEDVVGWVSDVRPERPINSKEMLWTERVRVRVCLLVVEYGPINIQ